MSNLLNHITLMDNLAGMALLPDESVHCVVTSPPYWGLRNYGDEVKNNFPEITFSLFGMPVAVPPWSGQLGLEPDPMMFVAHMVYVFREIRRVLRKDGTLWMNFGDSYAGSLKGMNADGTYNPKIGIKQQMHKGSHNPVKRAFTSGNLKRKDLCGIPWMVAFALRDDGWYLRQDIIWSKPAPMPESVRDRCTKSHEYIFLLSKSKKYFFDSESIKTIAKDPLDDLRRISKATLSGKSTPTTENNGIRRKYAWGRAIDGSIDDVRKGSGNEIRVRSSGNKRRKTGEERGCPENTSSNVCSSVPWIGATANKRSVWTIPTEGSSEAHFATFPQALIVDCIKAGSPEFTCSECGSPFIPIHSGHIYQSSLIGYEKPCKCHWAPPVPGIVLDPYSGRGTTFVVAKKHFRDAIAFEINPDYKPIYEKYVHQELGMFT